MNRIHSYEYMEEQINNSQTMTNSEKENYLKTYKTNYYAWLDELKNKLDATGIRLYVNVNNPVAKNLYEACGYVEDGRAIFMEK